MALRLEADPHSHDVIVVVIWPYDCLRELRKLDDLPFFTRRPPRWIAGIWEAAAFASHRARSVWAEFRRPAADPATDAEARSRLEARIEASLERLLSALERRAAAGIRVQLVLTPDRDAVEGDDFVTEIVAGRLRASGFPLLDMRGRLARTDYAELYFDDVHLNERGHAMYGELLAAEISSLAGRPPD